MAFNRNLNPVQIASSVYDAMHEGDPALDERGFTINANGPEAGRAAKGVYSVGHLDHELKIAHPDLDVQTAIEYVSQAAPTAAQMATAGGTMGIGGWGEQGSPDDYLDVTELIPRTTGDPQTDPGYLQAVNKAVAERQLGVGQLDAAGDYAGTLDVGTRSKDGKTYTVSTGPGTPWDALGPDPMMDTRGGLDVPMKKAPKRSKNERPGPAEGESFT